MQLENEFTVPVPVPQAWQVLLDVQRIAPCLPGATVERVEGDEVVGRVKVALGPMTLSYAGTMRFVEKDENARRLVMEASGREARGSGTASATIDTRMRQEDSSTRVTVVTDLNVTGKPAQFGRGVMADVAGKLMDQFASCVAEHVLRPAPAEERAAVPSGGAEERAGVPSGGVEQPARTEAAAGASSEPKASGAALDLVGAIAPAIAKRVAPVLSGVVVGLVLGGLLSRRPRVVVVVTPRAVVGRPSASEDWLTSRG